MRFAPSNGGAATECLRTLRCGDGYPLAYRTWHAHENPLATFVIANGMMSHSLWFRELAQRLVEFRLHVVGADRRGSGLNSGRRGDAPSRPALLDDLRRILDQERNGAPVYLAGWCWGALLTVNAALEVPDRISGLVLLAPGIFPSRNVIHAAGRASIGSLHEHPDVACLQSPVSEAMFSDLQRIRTFIAEDDLAQRTFTPRFFRISREMSLIAAARLSQLSMPVLLLLASDDETVDNRQTSQAFCRVPDVTMMTAQCHHAMQLEIPQDIAVQVARWITTHSKSGGGA